MPKTTNLFLPGPSSFQKTLPTDFKSTPPISPAARFVTPPISPAARFATHGLPNSTPANAPRNTPRSLRTPLTFDQRRCYPPSNQQKLKLTRSAEDTGPAVAARAETKTRAVRPRKPKRVLPCPYCEKTFQSKSRLERHVRSHTGERPFKCWLCGDKFKQKCHLTVHIQRHRGSRHPASPKQYFQNKAEYIGMHTETYEHEQMNQQSIRFSRLN